MKYDITQEDLKTMERDLQNDRVLKHLKNLSFYKFTIGDVLICEEKHRKYDGTKDFEWKTKLANCDLPYKYVYVFENELGIGYIHRLSINGRKFVERSICVTEFDPDQTRFILDPEYADHMLLADENENFDAKSRYDDIKKKREQIHRKNKKLCVQIDDEIQAAAWIKSLKVGDQIWWGNTINSIRKEPYSVQSINSSTDYYHGYAAVINVIITDGKYTSSFSSSTLHRYCIFTQRPTFIEDVIN
jgi:hypothetical protein